MILSSYLMSTIIHLTSTFNSLTSFQNHQKQRKISQIFPRILIGLIYFQNCLLEIQQWNVYIILKWMVYIHSILSFLHVPILFALIEQALNKLELPMAKGKTLRIYEQYLQNNLVKPYIQYLSKLCSIKTKLLRKKIHIQIEQQKDKRSDFMAENSTQRSSTLLKEIKKAELQKDQLHLFKILNLLNFAIEEFPHIIQQTKRYLTSSFPYCAKFSSFIVTDLKQLLSVLTNQNLKAQKTNFITSQQIQKIQERVNSFENSVCSHNRNKDFPNISIHTQRKACRQKLGQHYTLTGSTTKRKTNIQTDSGQSKLLTRRRTISSNSSKIKIFVHCTASCQDYQKSQSQKKSKQDSFDLASPIKPKVQRNITIQDQLKFEEFEMMKVDLENDFSF